MMHGRGGRRGIAGERTAPLTRLAALVLALVPAWGCADLAARLRAHTYPPEFHYINDEQLRSTMWRLAYHSRELRELMKSPEEAASRRAEAIDHLDLMEQSALDLNRSGRASNHPVIDANRASFLRDIRLARDGIRRDPPNFLLARSISGACADCHAYR